jgi:hypothetical protein
MEANIFIITKYFFLFVYLICKNEDDDKIKDYLGFYLFLL